MIVRCSAVVAGAKGCSPAGGMDRGGCVWERAEGQLPERERETGAEEVGRIYERGGAIEKLLVRVRDSAWVDVGYVGYAGVYMKTAGSTQSGGGCDLHCGYGGYGAWPRPER